MYHSGIIYRYKSRESFRYVNSSFSYKYRVIRCKLSRISQLGLQQCWLVYNPKTSLPLFSCSWLCRSPMLQPTGMGPAGQLCFRRVHVCPTVSVWGPDLLVSWQRAGACSQAPQGLFLCHICPHSIGQAQRRQAGRELTPSRALQGHMQKEGAKK